MSVGVGRAHGAVSVLNAIATGIGGAVGIDLGIEARIELTDDDVAEIRSTARGLQVEPPRSLVSALRRFLERLGHKRGFRAEVKSDIPVAVGLKSSSALVNSLISACLDALDIKADPMEVALMGVRLAKEAGLTLTGAYDDSLATVDGGVYITDNMRLRILRRIPLNHELFVVIRIPRRTNPIDKVDPSPFRRLRDQYLTAVEEALRGDWLGAMMLNGILSAIAIGVSGEELSYITEVLKLSTVKAAGVSGKGPAIFAVTEDPTEVLEVWGRSGDVLVSRILGDSP